MSSRPDSALGVAAAAQDSGKAVWLANLTAQSSIIRLKGAGCSSAGETLRLAPFATVRIGGIA
jgi:hypothetical protein